MLDEPYPFFHELDRLEVSRALMKWLIYFNNDSTTP
jgi:hypothetical protein